MVSCKEVGFEVYKIRKFECEDFKLSFHLFNDCSLATARSLSSSDGQQSFPWFEVGPKQKLSFADAVKKPALVVLTGANSFPVG